MSMIGPYAGVEADYRRSRITASFRAAPQDPPPAARPSARRDRHRC